jgi:hypothetical protein
MTRQEMLDRIQEINKKLGFVGSRGEMYLTDDRLRILLEELEEEVRSRG